MHSDYDSSFVHSQSHTLDRPDRTMQDIVYKLVPGLYKSKSVIYSGILRTGPSIIVDSAKMKLRPRFLICFVREKWSLAALVFSST